MKIARICLLTAAMCWAASVAYGQQATEQSPQAAELGQSASQQQDASQQQGSQNAQSFDAQQGALDQQQTQLEPPLPRDQQGELGQRRYQQRRLRMRQPGEPGMAGEGEPGVLGVLIIESAGPGVTIREVIGGSAAAEAGLQPGDVILEINGQGVGSPPQVTRMIRGIPAGQVATLNVWRDGQEQEIPATLQAAQRQPYRANFRGEAGGSMSWDAAARIERLESQMAMVMQELQRLRQEVMQLRATRAGQPSDATGIDTQLQPGLAQPDATQPGLYQLDATQPGLEQPDATQPELEEPATEPGLEEQPAEPETTDSEPALPF